MSYLEQRRAFIEAGRPLPEKKKYIIPKVSKRRAEKLAEQNKDSDKEETELQKWYDVIMKSELNKCWETGEWIEKYEKKEHEDDELKFAKGWHGSIAHCLPKSLFPSVKTHPRNYMILKMWGGTHGQYDSNWENASKMKVWPYACKIFNILYPLLTREEKSKLPDIIIQEIKPEIYNQ